MKRGVLWLPLGVFALFVAVVLFGLLGKRSDAVESRLVGQPLPAFTLQPMVPGVPGAVGGGQGARLVNVFASWCVPCIVEAPQLEALKRAGVTVDGIAIRDTREDVARFLAENGNPYRAIGDDPNSGVQVSLGSAGVPETFVGDGRGVIRRQRLGPVRPEGGPELAAQVRALQ